MKTTKTGAKSDATVPTVKSQMPADEWQKRVNSNTYRKKVGKFARLLKTLDPLGKPLNRAKREIAHYFLDAATVEETRRLRSPSERVNDSIKSIDSEDNKSPKKSISY